MSWDRVKQSEALKALFDGSSAQHLIVELATTEVNAAGVPSAGGGYGVLYTNPRSGEFATVVIDGVATVKCGSGGLAIGDRVTSAASGFATKANSAAGQTILGVARTSAASGSLASVELIRQISR